MSRSLSAVAWVSFALTGCVSTDHTGAETSSIDSAMTLSFHREHVAADVFHYALVLPLGTGANAAVRVHRIVREVAPYVPRPTSRAALLMHGDFSTFVTNFAPTLGDPSSPAGGLAPYLAARDIDVWGLDRRWALPGATDDVSDFATMGVAQELEDVRVVLSFARGVRLAGGSGGGKLALIGFSHGAQLAYTYASVEAARPASQRHVNALVPLDFYGDFGPDQVDERATACANSAFEYQLVADGVTDAPNDFFITTGQLAAYAPDDPSPLFEGMTNRAAMLLLLGQTYQFAPFAPFYHLLSPVLEGETAVGLRETSETAANAWIAGATPHQSMREAADFDALLCGDGSAPVNAPLRRIRVPLFYIGAAGGVGSLGIHATTQVSSPDVTTLVVQRFSDAERAADFGHADLLFADDAPTLAWQPLVRWLAHH